MATRKAKAPIKFLPREHILLTKELKEEVFQKTRDTIALAKKLWKVELPMPDIHFDLKRLVAGQAFCGVNKLRFHPIFLVENKTDYIRETVPHEVAHLLVPLVTPILFPKRKGKLMAHGPEWKAVMVALGVGPKTNQTWKDIIKSFYNPASLDVPPTRKHGPRPPGGRKVGDILAKIKGLKPDELEALKLRLGFQIGGDGMPRKPTKEEIIAMRENTDLYRLLLNDFPNRPPNVVSTAGWAHSVIKTFQGE